MALLEERKKRFAAEGLFDEARKKPLPFWPQVVGDRDLAHGRGDPRHAARLHRALPHACDRVAGARPGRDLRCGGGSRHPRLRRRRCAEPLSEAGPAHCGTRRRQPRRPLGLQRGGGCARGGRKRDPAYLSRWARNRLDVDRPRRGCARTDADESGGMGGAEAFRPDLAAFQCIGRARHSIRRQLEGLRAEFRGRNAVCRARRTCSPSRVSASIRQAHGSANRCAISATARGASSSAAPCASIRALFPRHWIAPAERLARAGEGAIRAFRLNTAKKRDRLSERTVRLDPRLVSAPLGRSAERLARAGEGAIRAFRLNTAKKRDRLDDRAARLQPVLLAGPAARQRERLQSLMARAGQGVGNVLKREAIEAASLSQLLRTLSHESVLDRGFALVRGADGHVIRRADAAKSATRLDIEFADGHVSARPGEDAEDRHASERRSSASPRRAGAVNKDDGSQGSLL